MPHSLHRSSRFLNVFTVSAITTYSGIACSNVRSLVGWRSFSSVQIGSLLTDHLRIMPYRNMYLFWWWILCFVGLAHHIWDLTDIKINDHEQHNGHFAFTISMNSVKVRPILHVKKYSPKNLDFLQHTPWWYSQRLSRTNALKERGTLLWKLKFDRYSTITWYSAIDSMTSDVCYLWCRKKTENNSNWTEFSRHK